MSIRAVRPIHAGLLALASLWLAGGVAASTPQPWGLNMTKGVSQVSERIYELHMMILIICCVIGVVVFGAMFWSIARHRKSLGVKPAQFSHSTKAEVVWTIIPCLILIGMADPATTTLIFMSDSSNPDMTIKVTGYQWMWRYEYLDEKIGFTSKLDERSNQIRQLGSGIDPTAEGFDTYLLDVDNPLVVPTKTKIRFLITADDVLHAWWVPQLGWKRDAIPGFINEAWTIIETPGTYRGQCAELCGKDHGFMPIVVIAKDPADYQTWLADQRRPDVSDIAEAQEEAQDESKPEALPLAAQSTTL